MGTVFVCSTQNTYPLYVIQTLQMKRIIKYVPFLAIVMQMSCSGGSDSSVSEGSIDSLLNLELKLDAILVEKGIVPKLDLVIENLILSDRIIELLSAETTLFSADLLHQTALASRYESSRQKAIALGVYGADMNYVLHYEQTQQSFKYLLVSKQLAENIGVAMAFDQKTMKNYEENTSHKDSLITIVHTAYANVKKHLRSSDQFLMSSLVIAGTWIENIYLATNHYQMTNDELLKDDLRKRILSQDLYLVSVISLIDDLSPTDASDVIDLLTQLKTIQAVYEDVSVPESQRIIDLSERIKIVRNTLLQN